MPYYTLWEDFPEYPMQTEAWLLVQTQTLAVRLSFLFCFALINFLYMYQ